ncbi:hypothetical protein E2C01_071815 [Portunus trituberculatus]|uniref:Secreted protein n=1 Tax=Portunus trituberculatus TaxID=210409 RepID=A0A5B7I4X0_PORTR|nr:hypothetical protein [Portunus trituberculatus]
MLICALATLVLPLLGSGTSRVCPSLLDCLRSYCSCLCLRVTVVAFPCSLHLSFPFVPLSFVHILSSCCFSPDRSVVGFIIECFLH